MAYDPNAAPPPGDESSGPSLWKWVAIAIVVLIALAIIWWIVADLIVEDDDELVEPVVEEPLEEEPLEEEDEGLRRLHPDRQLAFTIDGVDVVIAA